MKISYTEAAQQELKRFHERQQKLLENIVAERKYVFGDQTVEITASDIKEAGDSIRPMLRLRTRFRSIRLIGRTYLALGLLIASVGFLYPYITELIKENRTQGMTLSLGLVMALAGAAAQLYATLRERRFETSDRLTGKVPDWRPGSEAIGTQRSSEPEFLPVNAATLRAGLVKERDLPGLTMRHVDLRGMELAYRNLRGADFSGSDLSKGSLQGSDLAGATLKKAELDSVSFYEADLRGADLCGAKLRHGNFSKARLEKADLRDAVLEDVQLARATYDGDTKWPEGFDPDQYGAIRVEL